MNISRETENGERIKRARAMVLVGNLDGEVATLSDERPNSFNDMHIPLCLDWKSCVWVAMTCR